MLDLVFSPIDSALSFMPFWLRVSTWGLVLGAATMLIYKWLSPQEKITDIAERAAAARRQMQAYKGDDMSEVMGLVKRSLALSFEQMKFVIGPTLVAAAPVLVAMYWMEGAWAGKEALAWGPEFVRTWHTTFLGAMSVSALALKVGLRIK